LESLIEKILVESYIIDLKVYGTSLQKTNDAIGNSLKKQENMDETQDQIDIMKVMETL
jgi:hypothetical protein